MIDTVAFNVPITRQIFRLVKAKSTEYKKRDVQSGDIQYIFYKVEKKLGSYDRNVNFFLKDEYKKYIRIELSLPKYLYGTNVVLLSFDEVEKVLALLYADFVRYFGDFTPLSQWEVVRADLCYAWKLDTLDDCISILQILRRYENKRQQKTDYQTSIHSKGQWYSLKFYIKGAEFIAHDKVALCNAGLYNLARYLESYSRSVLRFEISLRRQALIYYKEKQHIYIKDLTKRFVFGMLKRYFKKYLRGMDTKMINTNEVMCKLREKYGQTKSSHLLNFYMLFNSKDKTAFELFCKSFSDRTIRRKFFELKKASVGLPLSDVRKKYQFSIPSPLEVISGDFLPARAAKNTASTVVTPLEAANFGQVSLN